MTPASGRLSLVALLALTLLYLSLVLPRIGLPLIYDDVNFAFAGEAVARTGVPFANAGYMSDRWDFSQRFQWALWHPPLYIYLLGMQAKLFGTSEPALRALGVAFNLGTAFLVYLTSRAASLAADGRAVAAGLLATAFYLLSPLVVQSSLILDIDGTVLTFLLAGMGYLAVRLPDRPGWRWPAAMGLLFALALWAKTTTPIGLLACLVLYQLLDRRFRSAALTLTVSGVGGTLLFLGSWWLVAHLLSMPFTMPFEVVWLELIDAAGSSRGWMRSVEAFAAVVAPPLLWASPFLGLLVAAAGLSRLAGFVRKPRLEPADLAIGFGAVVFIVYLIKLAGGFPKYHIAMLPFWAIAAAVLLVRRVPSLTRREIGLIGSGLVVLVWYYATRMSDTWVYGEYGATLQRLVVLPVLAAGGLALLFRLLGRRPVSQALLLSAAVMACAWGPGVEQRIARNGGSTTYFYGTRGQRETADAVDSIVAPDEPYAGAKEVAWYARDQHFIDQDTLEHFMRAAGGRFDGSLVGQDVRVVAVWVQPASHPPFYAEGLRSRFRLVARIGDYEIWQRLDILGPRDGR
ncbi:MAG: glycosyltransferase family 39 protein [Chloroflexi bacterium]|nr:glycosyltransferase family 39 protein [Chloroflexota bacterium]